MTLSDDAIERVVRVLDRLEDEAAGYVTLEAAERAAAADLSAAITDRLLLVDYRERVDGTRVTLCRLNRRHPSVQRLTAW